MISETQYILIEELNSLNKNSSYIENKYDIARNNDEMLIKTTDFEMNDGSKNILPSNFPTLDDIEVKFWKEINDLKNKSHNNITNSEKLKKEIDEEHKPRQKRKYVRKAKLMEINSDDEYENKYKTFIVDKKVTLSELIDDAILDSKIQIKKYQIRDDKNLKNNLSNDDTFSLSSSCNLKSEYYNSNSETAKINTYSVRNHKKSTNMNNCMWETHEVDKFYNLLEFLGLDFSLISSFMKTKTIGQIRVKFKIVIL